MRIRYQITAPNGEMFQIVTSDIELAMRWVWNQLEELQPSFPGYSLQFSKMEIR